MQLHSLTPSARRVKRAPVGRGGKRGKTSGRGGKGQTARAGHKIRPEARDMLKKLPKRRGYGRNRSRTIRGERLVFVPVNLSALDRSFEAGAIVSPATLLAKGLIRRRKGHAPSVKILGAGTLTKALVIRGCSVSESARAALAKAGATLNAS